MRLPRLHVRLRDFKIMHPIFYDALTLFLLFIIALVVVLFSSLLALADEMPLKPEPVARVKAVDREFIAEIAAMSVAWTLDTISTQQAFESHPNFVEKGYLFTGTRSTAKVAGAWAAVDVGAAVLAYEWKRHVHNRYLHPLWRSFMLQRAYAHSLGAAQNWSY